jgi:group I intron endonuclease
MIKPAVYKITNTENDKPYIGSSVDVYKRLYRHRNSLRKGTHPNLHLQSAYNLDGEESFTFEVLEETIKDKNLLAEREQYWIDYYDSSNPKKGYNILPKAHSGIGFKHTEAAKEAIRKARLGKHLSKESKQKVRNATLGHDVSEETRLKISEANLGKKAWNAGLETGPLSEKHKKAIGKGNIGKRKGMKASEETKEKLRISHLGQIPWQKKVLDK